MKTVNTSFDNITFRDTEFGDEVSIRPVLGASRPRRTDKLRRRLTSRHAIHHRRRK